MVAATPLRKPPVRPEPEKREGEALRADESPREYASSVEDDKRYGPEPGATVARAALTEVGRGEDREAECNASGRTRLPEPLAWDAASR
jgi:hypothetical protein